MLRCYFVLVLCCFSLSHEAPLTNREVMLYLADYGYLDPKVMSLEAHIPPDKIRDAVTHFQQFIGLKATGKMDTITKKTMQLPRCRVKDIFKFDNASSRRKRYTLWGSAWMKQELTYKIKRYPKLAQLSKMYSAAVDKEMSMAFSVWANVTNLSFKKVDWKADIEIEFSCANDSSIFNSEEGALAYARMPPIGDIVFNGDVRWTIRREYGYNLLAAAVHEIGHALGLAHSNVSGSIMQPMLTRGYTSRFMLHDDDITGIQELYGKKKTPVPDLCQDPSFDCIFKNPDGSLLVLKGEYYWKLGFDGLVDSFPHLIRHRWHGLPSDIDTALATSSGRTYFFKGDKYWAYEWTTLIPGHPRLISEGWPGIPNDVQAATWYRNSQFYFFKGDKFWLYDSHQWPNVALDFPKHISEWGEDIDGDFDDVLYLPIGYFYFFKGESYQRYNNYTGLLDGARLVKNGWYHCDEN